MRRNRHILSPGNAHFASNSRAPSPTGFFFARWPVGFGCLVLLTAAVLLLIHTPTARGAIYACRNADGSIGYTNVPSTGGCSVFQGERHYPAIPQVPVWESPDSATYDRTIRRAAGRYNVDPRLIKAMIRIESNFDPKAVSGQGALGLMQLMPQTCREMRVRDPFDPWQNINGGTRYFRYLLDSFNGDLMLSLAAYNAGPGTVRRAGGVPRIPETIRYVVRVLKCYRGYRQEEERSLAGN